MTENSLYSFLTLLIRLANLQQKTFLMHSYGRSGGYESRTKPKARKKKLFSFSFFKLWQLLKSFAWKQQQKFYQNWRFSTWKEYRNSSRDFFVVCGMFSLCSPLIFGSSSGKTLRATVASENHRWLNLSRLHTQGKGFDSGVSFRSEYTSY